MEKLSFQAYFLTLLESSHVAGLQQFLLQQKAACKQMLNKNKYDIQAKTALPKIESDLKMITAILKGHHNVINNHLQEAYDFKFEHIKVEQLPTEAEMTVSPAAPQAEEAKQTTEGNDLR